MWNKSIELKTPLSENDIFQLKAGDRVQLSGIVYTARDEAHKRLVKSIELGEKLPLDFQNQIFYYVGPAPAKHGRVIGPAGPTTATRMDPYTLPLLHHGLKGMIGKGFRNQFIREALSTFKAVYFVAVGGAAALIAERIKKVEMVAYEDLGPEAIYRFSIENFPLVVANDIYGGDLFEIGRARYRRIGA